LWKGEIFVRFCEEALDVGPMVENNQPSEYKRQNCFIRIEFSFAAPKPDEKGKTGPQVMEPSET
jgi:hypothetical protein